MHQNDVAVPRSPGLLNGLLALRGRSVVPVLRVDVPGDDVVAQLRERGLGAPAHVAIGRTHVVWLDAQYVRERVVDLRHLGFDLVGLHVCEVIVRPGVRGDLVPGVVRGLETRGAVVDALIESARDEEGCFGARRIQLVDKILLVLVRPVVECQRYNAGLRAPLDDPGLTALDPGFREGRTQDES